MPSWREWIWNITGISLNIPGNDLWKKNTHDIEKIYQQPGNFAGSPGYTLDRCKCYGGTLDQDILVCWDIYFNVNVKVCFRLEGLNNLHKTTMHRNKSRLGCHGPEKVQPWFFRCELYIVSREVAAEGKRMRTDCSLLPVNSIALSMYVHCYVHCLYMTMYLYQSPTCVAHRGAAWVFLVGGLEKTPSCRGYLQGSCVASWWIPAINEPHLLKFI